MRAAAARIEHRVDHPLFRGIAHGTHTTVGGTRRRPLLQPERHRLQLLHRRRRSPAGSPAASSAATASPMPELAPVMIATRWFVFVILLSLSRTQFHCPKALHHHKSHLRHPTSVSLHRPPIPPHKLPLIKILCLQRRHIHPEVPPHLRHPFGSSDTPYTPTGPRALHPAARATSPVAPCSWRSPRLGSTKTRGFLPTVNPLTTVETPAVTKLDRYPAVSPSNRKSTRSPARGEARSGSGPHGSTP